MIVVQVNVQGRKDMVMELVLHVSKPIAQLPDVVIVNQRHRAYNLAFGRLPCGLDKVVPNQIPESLRSVRIASLCDQPVKAFQQV
jgi:hypothetical protein